MKEKEKGLPSSAAGVIALVFAVIGYETALFVHKSAVTRIESLRDVPDTVYIIEHVTETRGDNVAHKSRQDTSYRFAKHSGTVSRVRAETVRKKVESFRFNPNTVSVEDLQRLGFSYHDAQSIERYRANGGRFVRKSDFRKSYAVSDSVYQRLEKYIEIPLVDLNLADSAAFDALPGIGGYFASRMVAHRRELGSYSYPEQLMDIYRFDKEKFEALKDLICLDSTYVEAYPLWTASVDSLKGHPYIKDWRTARAIVLFRENNPSDSLTVRNLFKAGIISGEQHDKLSRCRIKEP